MSELIIKIQLLVDKFGKDIMADKKFVNMLRDVYDFRYNAKLLDLIEKLYTLDCIKNVMSCRRKDLEKEIKKQVANACHQYSALNAKEVETVLYTFVISARIIDIDEYNEIMSSSSSIARKKYKTSPQVSTRSLCKLDSLSMMNLFTFILSTTIGLILFFVCLEANWWPFFCVLIVGIGDMAYFCITLNFDENYSKGLQKYNVKQSASFMANSLIGILKTVMLLPIIYNANGTYSYLLVCFLLYGWGILLWGLFSVNFKRKYFWSTTIKIFGVTSIFVFLLEYAGVFYHPIYAVFFPSKKCIFTNDTNK